MKLILVPDIGYWRSPFETADYSFKWFQTFTSFTEFKIWITNGLHGSTEFCRL